MLFSEGRKKVKDGKTTAKKKRTHSSEDEARPAGNGGAMTSGTNSGTSNTNGKGKNTKKQKVNQEKEGIIRKGQNKVNSYFHLTPHIRTSRYLLSVIYICYLHLFFVVDASASIGSV